MLNRLTWDVLGVVAVAIGASYTLTALARVVSYRIGLLDRPDGCRKSHTEPTPLLGGIALYGSLLIAFVAAWWIGLESLVDDADVLTLTRALLVSGGLFCLVGLWDDKCSLRPRTKLLLQIAASLPFVVWGHCVESLQFLGADLVLGPFGALFTIFWLVACANVINLVDGLDGLAGTIGMIVCVAVAVQSEMQGMLGVVAIALIAAGSLFGFLLHNWPPAKIFLGDSGSLLVGFLVGALSIEGSLKTATGFALAVPVVLISVPVFDTFIAILRRKLNGRSIGQPDRGHIHHCLQDRGLTRFQSLAAIVGLCLVMAAAALVSAYFQNDLLALGMCAGLLLLLIAGRVFGTDETLLLFRYLQQIGLVFVDASGALRTRLLLTRLRHDAPQKQAITYWERITRQVEQLGGTRLEFACRRRQAEDVIFRLTWSSEETPAEDAARWEIDYSVPQKAEVRLILRASGHCSERTNQQRPDELFRTFDAFCRCWPLEENLGPVPQQLRSPSAASIAGRPPRAAEISATQAPSRDSLVDARRAA